MAPPHGGKSAAEANDGSIPERRISSILFVIAMQTEASPLVNKLRLTEDVDSVFPQGVPWVRYSGVDSIGTVSASLVTYASIQALHPDLIINAGTAGGFKEKGASIGDVFLASHVAFHDRRNPLPLRDIYCIGLRQAFSTPNLAKELNLKVAKLSTGNSLDTSPQDAAGIIANDATVKDMEGAAIAYLTDLLKVPTIFLKAVTDIIDGDKPTAEEFLLNLATVTVELGQAAARIIDFINGKTLADLKSGSIHNSLQWSGVQQLDPMVAPHRGETAAELTAGQLPRAAAFPVPSLLLVFLREFDLTYNCCSAFSLFDVCVLIKWWKTL
ncbi:5'-methylthioadenosine/S-adenosylhomocysteinenucleosidase [Striga asiatica]|uniref:5'-methylthioadenosine/S-adenosylhomocysteinenucleosidase n=1 Tax=Striga asiatica TaxID=4170 RepID=A0A5A7QBD9_STRAF|nr:5'-methylthioadenosine/S-adenosylhomocysteinenucleosidase [Striga asiatica]